MWCKTFTVSKISIWKERYIPIKSYCYHSIIKSLQRLLSQPSLFDACDDWRNRNIPVGTYYDIYDGAVLVWKNFKGCDSNTESEAFFTKPNSYEFLLNVDWYEPFKHSVYAIGVLYLVLLNLPWHLRYDPQNIILCGIIPGPTEPVLTMNSFLEPLVDDLQLLWKGIQMNINGLDVYVRGALVGIACDSPATRKIAGFLAHSATKGCLKCLRSFETEKFGTKPNYGGFDRATWQMRSLPQHGMVSLQHKHAKNKRRRKN